MKTVAIILAAIGGAALGFVIVQFAAYPLYLSLTGARDIDGGIAMGLFMTWGPVGVTLGALIGVVVALKPPSARQVGMAVAGGAVALVGAGYWLNSLPGIGDRIYFDQHPDLHFEVRAPANRVVDDETFSPYADLHVSSTDSSNLLPTATQVSGALATIAGTIRIKDNMPTSLIRVYVTPEEYVKISLPLTIGASRAPGLTDWRPVDFYPDAKSGKNELGFAQKDFMYRYQAVARNSEKTDSANN